MPIYEYRCGDCERRVSLFYQSIRLAEEGQSTAHCPRCGGTHLTRLVSRFSVGRADRRDRAAAPANDFDPESAEYGENSGPGEFDEGGGMGALGGLNEQMMSGLDEDDPRSIARWARAMQTETGEDLGPEFNTALRRIEAGEDPDRVMEDVAPDLAEGGADGAADLGDDF